MRTLTKQLEICLKLIMTVVVMLVTWARVPELLTTPRFWAEEGTSYFAYAFNHSWLDNLLSPQYGYNTLYNSLATSLATIAPLNYAPLVTTWLAFIVQVSVSSAVIWWRIPLLNSVWQKCAVALLIQTLAYGRIWLTTIGVQYWLCVLSFLILLYEYREPEKKVHILHYGLLALNGLTGILSCLLIPAFVYKYIKSRTPHVLRQTMILCSCLAIQLGVFLHAYLNKSGDLSNRFVNSSFGYVLSKIIKFEFSVPFFGLGLYDSEKFSTVETTFRSLLFPVVGAAINTEDFGWLEMGLGVAVFCVLFTLIAKRFHVLETRLLLISLTTVTVISTYFSINRSGGPRYTFAPSVMILIFFVSACTDRTLARLFRYLAAVLVCFSLVVSTLQYRTVMGFAYNPQWPLWQFEVYKWYCDPSYKLNIWPPGWQMELTPEKN